MADMTNEQIARLAEAVAVAHFCKAVGGPFGRPLFRAVRLGDKYPTADLLVDVIDTDDRTIGYFFVQVKGTAGASPTAPRITIDVPADRFNALVRLPAPAYLLAVDVVREVAYLVAACRRRVKAVASVTKAFPLTAPRVRIDLYREVCGFWNARRTPRHTSGFGDE